ncbi:MAG TPA: alpha/beta hydrolase [Chloroflexota bacterium]|nr:alpha/beta hydrolase [Chloroflexota bacterium]
MPVGWEERDVDCGGVRLHVRQQTGEGRPIVLLHGVGVSGAVWQAFARRLQPGWRAIVPDLRGHAESDKPLEGYAPLDYARDVAALVEALGIGDAPVIGHSLGALVALSLSAQMPPPISAAILLDPPLDEEIENPDIEEVYRLRHAPPGELEAYLSAPILAPIFRQASDAPFEALLARPRGAPDLWALAPDVTVPVLLIQADPAQGGVLGESAARSFVARLPKGRLVQITGAPHAVHASHRQQVAEICLRFLSGEE